MALFSRSKKDVSTNVEDKHTEEQKDTTKKEVVVEKKPTAVQASLPTDRNLSSVIQKPRITEKAVSMGENNVYTFVIRKDATKYDVRDAVKELWDVTPIKVNIVNKSPRQHMSRAKGRKVTEKGMKKAYVYLKEGDSIELA